MRNHKYLRAFQLADELVVQIYNLTKQFPSQENYCLTAQMRRAAISVVSNIVEGCSRKSTLDYRRFLEMAFGSLKELHYQFGLAVKLEYIIDGIQEYDDKLEEAERVLASLIRSLDKLK